MISVRDRARGCLLGLAAGDALGAPAENLGPEEIAARWGVLTDIEGGGTDDTEYTIFAATVLLRHGHGLTSEDVARAWREEIVARLDGPMRGAGFSELGTVEALRRGLEPPLTGRWHAHGWSDGLAMRAAPYGIFAAGDPDEALESAELLLKERSLTSYYDEVALRGLQLAANDAGRGVLTGLQLEQVKNVAQALVHDLDSHDDVEPEPEETEDEPVASPASEKPTVKEPAVEAPPPEHLIGDEWRADGAIMCIAGRGPLDDAAADMLAQLLGKHRLGTRTVSHAEVSRTAIFNLDVTGVRMVCVCYLEIGGAPAHLRYLLKRLRKRIPDVPILVGLWPTDDTILQDESLRTMVGADYYVSSLRDGVICCLKVATSVEAPNPTEASAVSGQETGQVERLPLPA